MAQFIDAVILKGQGRQFTSSIQIRDDQNLDFVAFDLSPYVIRFRVMGSPAADSDVVLEHIISQVSDIENVGQITNAEAGEFTFSVTAEETNLLGLGKKPIMIDILDGETNSLVYTLTEGGARGEFNKIYIVQV